MTEPEWMRCTVDQWEKKSELSIRSGQLGEALKYADYANCREMYEDGMEIEEIQNRFGDVDG